MSLLNLNQTIVSKLNATLLYQASRDGFNAKAFHAKCDGVLGTLILVKTNNANIFGGFTKADWYSSVGYLPKYDDDAFLFSLVNSYNIPVKMNIITPSNAIVAADYLGPSFGDSNLSCDLCFSQTSPSGDFSYGSSSVGGYYQLPSYPSDLGLLAGSITFYAIQIEVFSIQY